MEFLFARFLNRSQCEILNFCNKIGIKFEAMLVIYKLDAFKTFHAITVCILCLAKQVIIFLALGM